MANEGYRRAEEQYLDYAAEIIECGEPTDDRTGVGTLDYFGEPQMKYDLRKEFPLLTSKFVATKHVRSELVWMLHGDTNLRYLAEHDNHIWDEWPFVSYLRDTHQEIPVQNSAEWNEKKANYIKQIIANKAISGTNMNFAEKYGELGPIYGHQWRAWQDYEGNPIDQLANAQNDIRVGNSRRIIVSAWNVADLEAMSWTGLPPCHTLFQFNAPNNAIDPDTGKKYLDAKLYQRSADWFLGVPFNMAQYAMLLTAMAQTTDRAPRYLYHTFGSAHIYKNHLAQAAEQLSRRDHLYDTAKLTLNPDIKDIGNFDADDFIVTDYMHHPSIKAPVAI